MVLKKYSIISNHLVQHLILYKIYYYIFCVLGCYHYLKISLEYIDPKDSDFRNVGFSIHESLKLGNQTI
jgi:hypothetical protein